jgi:hypothetical protein
MRQVNLFQCVSLTVLGMGVVASLLLSGQAASGAAKAFGQKILWPTTGIYTEGHTVLIYEGPEKDWQPAKVENCLGLRKVPGKSAYDVDVTLVTTNAHICAYATQMVFDASHNVLLGPPMETYSEDKKPCRLKIHVEKTQFRFEDPDWACKSLCGARASFDGATIKRARTPQKWNAEACGNN